MMAPMTRRAEKSRSPAITPAAIARALLALGLARLRDRLLRAALVGRCELLGLRGRGRRPRLDARGRARSTAVNRVERRRAVGVLLAGLHGLRAGLVDAPAAVG